MGVHVSVSVFPPVHVCLTVHLCMRANDSSGVCVCFPPHKLSEDGADVCAVAGLARCSACVKKKGFSLFVSNFTSRPNGHRHASKINK